MLQQPYLTVHVLCVLRSAFPHANKVRNLFVLRDKRIAALAAACCAMPNIKFIRLHACFRYLTLTWLPTTRVQVVIAGIEEGAAAVSTDWGVTWEERNSALHVDVHQLRPDPHQPTR